MTAEPFLLGLFAGALAMWPLVLTLNRIVRPARCAAPSEQAVPSGMNPRRLLTTVAIAIAWTGFLLMVLVTVTPSDVALRCLGF